MVISKVTGDPYFFTKSSGFLRLQQYSSPMDTEKFHNYYYATSEIKPIFGVSDPGTTYWQERNLFSTGGDFHCTMNSGTQVVSLPKDSVLYTASYNKAYGRLVENLKRDKLELGLNLAEARETFSMMINRVTQLTRAAQHLKRGDLRSFFQTLGLTEAQGTRINPRLKLKRPTSKDFANYWLEYWLGWSPLVSDLLTLAGRIAGPYNKVSVRTGAGTPWAYRSFKTSTGSRSYHTEQRARTKLRLSVDISYDDPEAYTSWDNGLNNLAQVAWGAVPVSFLADWFVNIDQLLGSMTDFGGVSLKQVCVSYKTEYKSVHTWPLVGGSTSGAFSREKNSMTYGRKVLSTVTLPSLQISLPDYNLTRLLTATSLFRNVVLK